MGGKLTAFLVAHLGAVLLLSVDEMLVLQLFQLTLSENLCDKTAR